MKTPSLISAFLLAGSGMLSAALASDSGSSSHWADIWTALPQLPQEPVPAPFTNPNGNVNNTTIRQTLHLTLPTDKLRVQISNGYGSTPLGITAASAALTKANVTGTTTGSPTIEADTLQKLTFGGNSSINIPVGAVIVSDPVQISTHASQDLSVSLYLAEGQIGLNLTVHSVSHTTSWLAPGDQTMRANLSCGAASVPHWYYVTAVEAWLPSEDGALICIGDSITDGAESSMNGNDRWVDDLFRRMQNNSETKNIAVLNAGIGDFLAQPGIRYVTILEGVNDIGYTDATTDAQDVLYYTLVAGLEQFITQIHAFGLPVFGATLTPFHDPPYASKTSKYSIPIRENTRNRLNDWIMNHSNFDYVVDYASAVANKSYPNQYQDQLAFTNYIHPNDKGHQVVADAWDLSVFRKFANGVSGCD